MRVAAFILAIISIGFLVLAMATRINQLFYEVHVREVRSVSQVLVGISCVAALAFAFFLSRSRRGGTAAPRQEQGPRPWHRLYGPTWFALGFMGLVLAVLWVEIRRPFGPSVGFYAVFGWPLEAILISSSKNLWNEAWVRQPVRPIPLVMDLLLSLAVLFTTAAFFQWRLSRARAAKAQPAAANNPMGSP